MLSRRGPTDQHVAENPFGTSAACSWRIGLAQVDDRNHIVTVARQLPPQRPGLLDEPVWTARPRAPPRRNPDCDHCPLGRNCAHLIDTIAGVRGGCRHLTRDRDPAAPARP